jgi:hypothetical protein
MTAAAAARPAFDASSGLRLVEVSDRPALDRFIDLPRQLYSGQPGFVAPLAMERRDALGPKNPYFRHARAQYWLALRGERPVGRISAQVDELSLARHGPTLGHFGLIDAEDDPAVFALLTGAAEGWLKAQGMDRVRGPFNLSVNEECGLLVEGFEGRSMLMMGYVPPYAGRRIEEQGYAKARDLIAFDYDLAVTKRIDPRGLKRVAGNTRINIRPLDMKNYRRDLALILDVFNDAWSENWGFVPFTEDEIVHAASSMRPLIIPRMVWLAEVDGQIAGMIVALPNLNDAIADLDGSLLPFGWAKLLWRLKVRGVRTARVPLFGVRRRYHRTPLGAALAGLLLQALRDNGVRHGFTHAELSWILEDNVAVRRVIEGVGGRRYKTYRIYEKALA